LPRTQAGKNILAGEAEAAGAAAAEGGGFVELAAGQTVRPAAARCLLDLVLLQEYCLTYLPLTYPLSQVRPAASRSAD
jgi:hypothetical protein